MTPRLPAMGHRQASALHPRQEVWDTVQEESPRWGYVTRAPMFSKPCRPPGDERSGGQENELSAGAVRRVPASPRRRTLQAANDQRGRYDGSFRGCWPPARCGRFLHLQARAAGGDPGSIWPCQADSGDDPGAEMDEVPPESQLEGVESPHPDHLGIMSAEKYFFAVSLGDRIPTETAASRVKSSRLATAPEWRSFLKQGGDGDLCDGIPLDDVLQCPCCLGLLRRPVGLPCGHTLCRGCLMRLPVIPSEVRGQPTRRCPLCRAEIPRVHLAVNEQLDVVAEALHVYRATREAAVQRHRQSSVDVPGRRPFSPLESVIGFGRRAVSQPPDLLALFRFTEPPSEGRSRPLAAETSAEARGRSPVEDPSEIVFL